MEAVATAAAAGEPDKGCTEPRPSHWGELSWTPVPPEPQDKEDASEGAPGALDNDPPGAESAAVSAMLQAVASSRLPVCSQQRGEPDLTEREKVAILRQLYHEKPLVFLERFRTGLREEHLACFGHLRGDHRADFYCAEVARQGAARPRALRTRLRNRRYAALQKLIQGGEYFSDEQMRFRAPLLYEQYIGQYLTQEELSARALAPQSPKPRSPGTHVCLLSDLLLQSYQERELQQRLLQQQEEEEACLEEEEEEEDSDEEARWTTTPTWTTWILWHGMRRRGTSMSRSLRMRPAQPRARWGLTPAGLPSLPPAPTRQWLTGRLSDSFSQGTPGQSPGPHHSHQPCWVQASSQTPLPSVSGVPSLPSRGCLCLLLAVSVSLYFSLSPWASFCLVFSPLSWLLLSPRPWCLTAPLFSSSAFPSPPLQVSGPLCLCLPPSPSLCLGLCLRSMSILPLTKASRALGGWNGQGGSSARLRVRADSWAPGPVPLPSLSPLFTPCVPVSHSPPPSGLLQPLGLLLFLPVRFHLAASVLPLSLSVWLSDFLSLSLVPLPGLAAE
ncbi:coiled-coil domain-containing protein 97 isoform 1-T1 [Dugong dugon]